MNVPEARLAIDGWLWAIKERDLEAMWYWAGFMRSALQAAIDDWDRVELALAELAEPE